MTFEITGMKLEMFNMFIWFNPPATSKIGTVEEKEPQNGKMTCLVSTDAKRWNLNKMSFI